MMKQRQGLDRNVLRPTPGDPWGVEQHHWKPSTYFFQQIHYGLFRNHFLTEQQHDLSVAGKQWFI